MTEVMKVLNSSVVLKGKKKIENKAAAEEAGLRVCLL